MLSYFHLCVHALTVTTTTTLILERVLDRYVFHNSLNMLFVPVAARVQAQLLRQFVDAKGVIGVSAHVQLGVGVWAVCVARNVRQLSCECHPPLSHHGVSQQLPSVSRIHLFYHLTSIVFR